VTQNHLPIIPGREKIGDGRKGKGGKMEELISLLIKVAKEIMPWILQFLISPIVVAFLGYLIITHLKQIQKSSKENKKMIIVKTLPKAPQNAWLPKEDLLERVSTAIKNENEFEILINELLQEKRIERSSFGHFRAL